MAKLQQLVLDNPVTTCAGLLMFACSVAAKLPQCAQYKDALLQAAAGLGTLTALLAQDPHKQLAAKAPAADEEK